MTVLELARAATAHFAEKGSDSARADAELLLARALGTDRLGLYLAHDSPVAPEVRQSFRDLVRRRVQGEPVAYILGVREFHGLEFQVDRRCLIPRPETEHLVDEALQVLKAWRPGPGAGANPRVADVATGSGCIAIAVAHGHPGADVVASDVSAGALEVAQANAARLVPGAPVRFVLGDLVAPLEGRGLFDLILSNPPYVTDGERNALPASVRDWEPGLALFSGGDAFTFHDRLIRSGMRLLGPGGRMVLELPGRTEREVGSWMAARHPEVRYRTGRDLAGLTRVLMAESP